jgi:hypothetical protein
MTSPLLTIPTLGTRLDPRLLIPLGAALGCLVYLLWGRAGRLAIARRQGFLAHLVGRPIQRLHLGRVCLQCGRMHFTVATPRELWRLGHFCSATCLVDAQDADRTAMEAERTAVHRMRELFVYPELDRVLQGALTREAVTRPPSRRQDDRARRGHNV